MQSKFRQYGWRLGMMEGTIYLLFALVLGRAFMIHMYSSSQESLKQIASQQYHTHMTLGNYRGTILDRRNTPLALSVKKPSLAVNPRVFAPTATQMTRLCQLLDMTPHRIEAIAQKRSYFSWLYRHSSSEVAQQVMALNIPGVFRIQEPSRFYPMGAVSSHVIGKVNIDNEGILGLERMLEQMLSGQAGQIVGVRDGRGQLILQNAAEVTPEQFGNNVMVSLDGVVQEVVSEELQRGVEEAGALSGFVLVAEPFTGAILAVASWPHYDPNAKKVSNIQLTRNKALTDIFEPGSIVKPFVLAEALLHEVTTMETEYEFSPSGVFRFEGGRIHDDHPKPVMTAAEIIIHSSNIGSFYLAQKLGPAGLWEAFHRLGIGKRQDIKGLGPLAMGRLSAHSSWHPMRFANVSFGQGFAVTGLDILRAYNVLASGGKTTPLYFLDKITHPDGGVVDYRAIHRSRTVYPEPLARAVGESLYRTTSEGTGRLAQSALYTVAGKTGTSEIYDPELGRYAEDRRHATFAGYAPYHDPKITVVVLIDEPSLKPYYGGKWAAPVFQRIVDRVLPYLNVPSDKTPAAKRSSQPPTSTALSQSPSQTLSGESRP